LLLEIAQRLRKRGRALMPQPPLELGALARAELGVAILPLLACRSATRTRLAPHLQHVVGHRERLLRNAELLFRSLQLVGAERFAMRLVGAGLVRRAVADRGLAGDQAR